jgi:hypothetical protein
MVYFSDPILFQPTDNIPSEIPSGIPTESSDTPTESTSGEAKTTTAESTTSAAATTAAAESTSSASDSLANRPATAEEAEAQFASSAEQASSLSVQELRTKIISDTVELKRMDLNSESIRDRNLKAEELDAHMHELVVRYADESRRSGENLIIAMKKAERDVEQFMVEVNNSINTTLERSRESRNS